MDAIQPLLLYFFQLFLFILVVNETVTVSSFLVYARLSLPRLIGLLDGLSLLLLFLFERLHISL